MASEADANVGSAGRPATVSGAVAASPLAGLSSAEAAARLARYGPNSLPPPPSRPLWRRLLAQFASPLIAILLVALVIDLGVWLFEGGRGLPLEAIAIGAILILNAGLGITQEYRAEAALERLEELSVPRVWVLRDGRLAKLPSPELVPGDIVRLEAGDRVPADGVARKPEGAMLDTSVLTGESVPTEVAPGSELPGGTLLVRGRTYLEVTRTGADSALGQLAGMLGRLETEATPLERRLDRFGRSVARWVTLLAVALLALGLALEGWGNFLEVFLFAVALAVAAVPEGLPAVLSATLALGTERMARRRAVVRRLAAVEALGSVTVIATDKTGTLTENQMRVKALDSNDDEQALLAMVLANDADAALGAGDPLELGLLAYAAERGYDPQTLRARYPRREVRPFDSAWRFMRVTVETAEGAGERLSYFKGAPEALLARSRLSSEERARWQEKVEAYGHEGYRTLALARSSGNAEEQLTFLGLVLLHDPPRPEVPKAIAEARAAGIRVLMMTGDHPATALAIAREVGIPAGRVLTDVDLEGLDEAQLRRAIEEVSVLARVRPEHKLAIVEALKAAGEVVAVTGDGVNDAPALKRADVGVAMGRRGSDVAREVADLVLLDDNFATIVAAIEEGRSIYANIQKFLRFLFSTNLAEVLVVVVGLLAALLLGLRGDAGEVVLPLTAVQILWINLVTDSLPALALALDRNPAAMRRPPRPRHAPLLERPALAFIVVSGLSLGLLTISTLVLLSARVATFEQARTAAFMLLVLGQLLYSFSARRLAGPSPYNPWLSIAVLGTAALQLAVLVIPWARTMLTLTPLPTELLLWVLLGAGLAWLASEGAARWFADTELLEPAAEAHRNADGSDTRGNDDYGNDAHGNDDYGNDRGAKAATTGRKTR